LKSDNSPFLSKSKPVCPPELLQKAQALPPSVVAIAGADAKLPMSAAKEATDAGIMKPLFTGNLDEIQRLADDLAWDISRYKLINTKGEESAAAAAAQVCGQGQADVMMKGQVHTDTFVRAALSREYGLRTDQKLVHIFHITAPGGGRPLLLTDAAVNVNPTIETLQIATRAAVTMSRTLGTVKPSVAYLSATESPIPSVPSAVAARELSNWAKANISDAEFSGPLAFDLILSKQAAGIKNMGDDPVAGAADIIVVPDIVSGNSIFKALVYLSGGCAAGIVTGAAVPLLLTSRADTAAARLASVALAGIMAAKKEPPGG